MEKFEEIIHAALEAAQPDFAVRKALEGFPKARGRVVLVAIGKAAWAMAQAAEGFYDTGVIITKYGHVGEERGAVKHKGLQIFEAGHPMPDENSFAATEAAINAVCGLGENDIVLFLISGGGSALFEKPLIPAAELFSITEQLLASGADIVEMNTIRKRLSAVKGGRFAETCAPAQVFSVVLSDIIGDPLDMIASGPAFPDNSTAAQALEIAEKYGLSLSPEARNLLSVDLPKNLPNVTTHITGSVRQLCLAAEKKCRELGYTPHILTDSLSCTARDAGSFLASIARYHSPHSQPLAFIVGGETVVRLCENPGKGGRNQEIALSAAHGIAGLSNVVVFSVGSDGTDGPTDAAGGFVTGETWDALVQKGLTHSLEKNDAYHALEAVGGLIKTGPTGTNVNDLSVILLH
jgi:hydroxypyruvate reductase